MRASEARTECNIRRKPYARSAARSAEQVQLRLRIPSMGALRCASLLGLVLHRTLLLVGCRGGGGGCGWVRAGEPAWGRPTGTRLGSNRWRPAPVTCPMFSVLRSPEVGEPARV